MLAVAQFGGSRPEFQSTVHALESQFDMMLGGLPEDFTDNLLFACYVVCFNLIVFFLLLNFLLAIIVEAYLKVKEALEEQQTEQAIPTPAIYSTLTYLQVGETVHQWWRRDTDDTNQTA